MYARLRLATCVALALVARAATADVQPFRHDRLDAVLRRVVDGRGRVDYAALRADPADLRAYLATLEAVSPDSHPGRFPSRDDRLAYWINAYNAWVLHLVERRYPIASVRDVFPPLVGFFVLQRIRLGGDVMSLRHLENGIVRARFPDPRIHAALNCASRGCPRLPARAFTAAGLQEELEREARRFVAEPRNVAVDLAARTVRLSPIFTWYRGDFTRWMRVHRPGESATPVGWVRGMADPELRAALDGCVGCAVRFAPYDWGLNDRAAP